jgi:VanZ family protein
MPEIATAAQAPARLWRGMFIALLCAVLYLALKPAEPTPDWFAQADKLRHAGAFLVLFGLGLRAGFRPLPLAAGLLLFGVGIEIAQSFTPTREASAADVAADAVGIALALGIRRFSRPAT